MEDTAQARLDLYDLQRMIRFMESGDFQEWQRKVLEPRKLAAMMGALESDDRDEAMRQQTLYREYRYLTESKLSDLIEAESSIRESLGADAQSLGAGSEGFTFA